MEPRRRALGRGLGALIPSASYTPPEDAPSEVDSTVAIDDIAPNPHQPREHFADVAIDELAASIRARGVLQPLVVRRTATGYELIAGERRFRAARKVGLARVPVVVRDADSREALELALIENVQREDLNAIEEARAYRRLVDEFGLTQEQVADKVAKSRSAVTNSLRLLQLPEEIRQQIAEGALSAGHARSLLAMGSDEERVEVSRQVTSRNLSVRDTERLVRDRTRAPEPDRDLSAAVDRLTRALATRVRIKTRKGGGGTISVECYSAEELDGLIDRLATVS